MSKEIGTLIESKLKTRHRREMRFKNFGAIAVILSLLFLLILFTNILSKGYSAFFHHQIALKIDLSKISTINNLDLDYKHLDYKQIIADSLPINHNDVISKNAITTLKNQIKNNPALIGKTVNIWFDSSSNIDLYLKGKVDDVDSLPNFDAFQAAFIDDLKESGKVRKNFNWKFLSQADSREPEMAGMAASITGSFFTIIIFLLAAFPIGVMSGFYLEEFAKKNIITDIIEISINNLAAIPSIIFGLLGLVVYLNFFSWPRSSSLVGGMTLSLLVLPIIIIATRSAIKTIPTEIKDAATALGASKMQVTLHHILPLSLSGIMTGTILAVSRAIGETAPLLMIGMVAFIADIPQNFAHPATTMPVQIYLWSDSAEGGFAEKTAAAIMVLLGCLIILNGFAVYLRKKFEKRW